MRYFPSAALDNSCIAFTMPTLWYGKVSLPSDPVQMKFVWSIYYKSTINTVNQKSR